MKIYRLSGDLPAGSQCGGMVVGNQLVWFGGPASGGLTLTYWSVPPGGDDGPAMTGQTVENFDRKLREVADPVAAGITTRGQKVVVFAAAPDDPIPAPWGGKRAVYVAVGAESVGVTPAPLPQPGAGVEVAASGAVSYNGINLGGQATAAAIVTYLGQTYVIAAGTDGLYERHAPVGGTAFTAWKKLL